MPGLKSQFYQLLGIPSQASHLDSASQLPLLRSEIAVTIKEVNMQST